MRKEAKAAIAIILAVWFFIMGFELGSYKEKKKYSQENSPAVNTTAPTVAPTNAPTQQIPATEPTTAYDPFAAGSNTPPSSAPASNEKDPASLSKDEILTNMMAAYRTLETEQNFTAHKNLNITVNIVSCSVPSAVSGINDIITGITDKIPKEENLVFSGGVATTSDGTQVTPKDAFPPDTDFNLPSAGVASATASKQGDNTVYSITIVSEDTTIESPVPPYNSTAGGYLDITSLGLPDVITKGDMHYPGSTFKLTVNSAGKVVGIESRIPMTGEGEAKVIGITGNATFEGALDEKWSITY